MNPEGHYVKVYCHDITGVGGNLKDGTGTFTHSTRTFSCGTFSEIDRPKVGSRYNLNGEHENKRYEFSNWICTHSGATSDFKEK
ncbi:MAG TPA: hypothetical protein VJ725_21345 [Thermoanaerobaculia bacterium]|nr:hypothetical protein [Thermoanaerobaculia bacterium]